jgi:hypothetical protein
VLYSTTTIEEGEIIDTVDIRIVDDQNLPGANLAIRRLQLLNSGVKLKQLARAVFFLGDLIKLATSSTWFIDYAGNVFRYVKSKNVKLTFKKITKILPIKSGGAIVEIDGIPTRFKSLYMPNAEDTHAGVLCDKASFILYGFYDKKYSDTRRLI